MISIKKHKKVLISIIAILLILVISFVFTVIIYNTSFSRYDCTISETATELKGIINNRQTYNYKCKKNTLTGFLYNSYTENNNTLIVLAPGYNACSDDYLWQIKELLDYGWSVFSFDTTGCCKSEGNSAIGFSQEIIDLYATLDFIKSNNNFGFKNIVLLGHSRGGYAACCALSSSYDISAVISISGINSAMEGIMGSSTKYVGKLAYANYGFLWLYQTILFGKDIVNLKADEILNETDKPVLVIHGTNDIQVPVDKYSIISHKENINNQNVEYYLCSSPNGSGHTSLLFEENGTADNNVIEKINNFINNKVK